MGMFGLLAALATLFARPIRPRGAPDSSQKTRFVPTHARFVTFSEEFMYSQAVCL
jgi:hypothetical protein